MNTIKWDRLPVRVAGCYSDVPLTLYHSANICDTPSISSTGLRAIYTTSPAHYFATSPYDQNRPADTESDTEWSVLGRAAHHLLIGSAGHSFADEYVIRPATYVDDTGKTKPWSGNAHKCKKWLADASHAGKTVLTEDQIYNIKGMATSLGKDELVRQGVLDGLVERSLFWPDKETGVWLKARPDVIPTGSGDVVDFKTTESTRYLDLGRSLAKFGYYQQGALIADGLQAVFGLTMTMFYIVWVEKVRPWCVRLTPIAMDDIERGRKRNRVAIRRFADCMSTGRWPGPAAYDSGDEFAVLRLSDAERDFVDRRLKWEGM
jgi:hypothetical protein